MTYPWLQPLLDELTAKYAANKLPHAMLVKGQAGLGKYALALDLASNLLCQNKNACGECKGCLLLAAGTHPDLKILSPEEDSKQIKIEQVRNLIHWVNQTAQLSGAKISIIAPAHAMNRSSANGLLKIMEEPPPNNHLILVSDDPAALLPTLRSRAQQIQVSAPSRETAISWLEGQANGTTDWQMILSLSNGAPLAAVERADPEYLARRQLIGAVWRDLLMKNKDVVTLVESVTKLDLVEILGLGMDMLADVARSELSKDENLINNKDLAGFIKDIRTVMSSKAALFQVARMQQDYRLAKGTQNPNQNLMLEALMIDFLDHKHATFSL